MPEYLYPGVYVEETDAGTTPIEGVPTVVDPARLRALAADLARVASAHAPGWTDRADADPGVTLVDLVAFLAGNLHCGAEGPGARERSAAIRAASALAGFAQPSVRDCAPIVRPRWFAGRLIDAATLAAEQDYHRENLRRHHRALHGFGIVSGLRVRIDAAGEAERPRVVVQPGTALDAAGQLLHVPCGARLALPAVGDHALVTLRHGEHARGPVPVPGGDTLEHAETEEVCIVGIGAVAPDAAIAIARLERADDAWRVDPAFAPPRCRRPE